MLNVIRDDADFESPASSGRDLSGVRVALTGRFASMSQRDFASMINSLGGECVSTPGRHTKSLIVGAAGPPLGNDGQPTQTLQRARQLIADGYDIEIIQEDAFLQQIDLLQEDEQVHQRYTLGQLSRILDVPHARIRTWIRTGLIEPVHIVNRLSFFDFKQVTSAKVLCDLLSEGLPLAKIREGLHRVRAWLPGMDSPLGQLSVLEENGRLLLRLDDGRLAEPTGQLQLDFDAIGEERSFAIENAKTSDQYFQDALECENVGDYDGAISAYRNAIDQDSADPILHFNLGNVLYASQRLLDAEEEFRQAVDLDPNYVEAWNNLGTVLADLDRYAHAVEALERALEIFPLYADAHYNLGDVHASAGRSIEARKHWESYLQLDPKSPWSADIRLRLSELQNNS